MKKNRFKKLFGDMPLKKKLVCVYIIACLVPVIAVLFAAYLQMREILWDKEIRSVDSYVYQSISLIDKEMDIFSNLADYVSFNQSIAQVVKGDKKSDYQLYEQITSTVDPLLTSLMYFHNDLNTVTMYIEGSEIKHGTTLDDISVIENEPWFETVKKDNNIHWYVDTQNKKVYSVNKMAMLDQYGVLGVLYMEIDYDTVFKAFDDTIMSNIGIYVLDQNGKVVFRASEFEGQNNGYSLNEKDFREEINKDNSEYQIVKRDIDTTGWSVYVYKPDKLIISSMNPLLKIVLITLVVSIFASVAGATIVSKFITNRIATLRNNMEKIENGDLKVNMENDSSDEIGELIIGFNHMVKRLDLSVDELYRGKIREKEYEMKALQAQINPHFLYNSLSIINWKAIQAGEDDISKITLSLSTFYRTSLNKGKNVMSIQDEIDNMNSYLNIQLIMHDKSFDTVVDIDSNIMKYKTLNLILQPLIENAIDHGIDVMEEGRGKIEIKGFSQNNEIFLTVSDNGIGMTEEQCKKILTEESKGYGVRNVNERIKLYYGEEYALKIESEIGKGTKVTVRFPMEI